MYPARTTTMPSSSEGSQDVGYHPLQSNLNPQARHLIQPFTFARSRDSPQCGHVVSLASSSRASCARGGMASLLVWEF